MLDRRGTRLGATRAGRRCARHPGPVQAEKEPAHGKAGEEERRERATPDEAIPGQCDAPLSADRACRSPVPQVTAMTVGSGWNAVTTLDWRLWELFSVPYLAPARIKPPCAPKLPLFAMFFGEFAASLRLRRASRTDARPKRSRASPQFPRRDRLGPLAKMPRADRTCEAVLRDRGHGRIKSQP
jgi:hypothetical protein